MPRDGLCVKIAIGIFRLDPLGGLEDHAIRIAAALSERGHEVEIHTSGKTPPLDGPIGVQQHRRRAFSNHGQMAAFASDFAHATRRRYDRTVAFQPMPGCDVLFLADQLRDLPETPLWKRLLPRFKTYARLEAGCLRSGAHARIMGLARRQMDAFVARYPGVAQRAVVLPPTISIERRHPERRTDAFRTAMRQRLGIATGSQVWLWVGLQPYVKGLDRVIAALEKTPDATLLVVGLGQGGRKLLPTLLRSRLRAVSDRIKLLGFIPGADMPDYMVAADVLVHPARMDVTGAIILEAVVNGLPTVATDACGFAEHVARADAGRVISSAYDRDELVRAVTELRGLRNAECSRNGIAYGQAEYLFSGVGIACDLIEADAWPPEMTIANAGRMQS